VLARSQVANKRLQGELDSSESTRTKLAAQHKTLQKQSKVLDRDLAAARKTEATSAADVARLERSLGKRESQIERLERRVKTLRAKNKAEEAEP
jgi:chromosome segregation ATPase